VKSVDVSGIKRGKSERQNIQLATDSDNKKMCIEDKTCTDE
jgi:hypothetical protein